MRDNRPISNWLIAVALTGGALLPWSVPALASATTPVTSDVIAAGPSRLFEFHSAFWINLHHFLYLQARARMDTPDSHRPAVAGVRADMEMICKLPPDQRQPWNAALDCYERDLAKLDLIFDGSLVKMTNKIATQESIPSLHSSGLDPAVIHALEGAAPVYRSHWWPRHDQMNRAWAAMIDPLLRRYGDSLAQEIAKAYQTNWPAKPFRVDLCAYANWAGAYTVDDMQRITLSSLDEGNGATQGLEGLFHESLHVLEGPVVAELLRQAKAQGKEAPRFLSHALIFYTAGEITRRTVSGHKPYAVGHHLWNGDPWSKYWNLLRTYWQPYLDGRTSLVDAMRDIVAGTKDNET
ncbi:MAG: hypothetical protein M3N48_09830 [Verrucomicrobiota bacterium]|nr:hypothetical protein [Verrucomicrobiota bacterium]